MMNELIKSTELENKFVKLNVVIIGLPGSGKSSLMNSLSIKPNYLSLGDITRFALTTEAPLAKAIREIFQTSEPWPAEFVMDIISPYLLTARANNMGFVLDGIPRKVDEAKILTDWAFRNEMDLDLVLHLQIDPEKAIQRIVGRDNSGRLETMAHYANRISKYLAEEEEMLVIMQKNSRKILTINTDNNPPGFAKFQLLDFIRCNF